MNSLGQRNLWGHIVHTDEHKELGEAANGRICLMEKGRQYLNGGKVLQMVAAQSECTKCSF